MESLWFLIDHNQGVLSSQQLEGVDQEGHEDLDRSGLNQFRSEIIWL